MSLRNLKIGTRLGMGFSVILLMGPISATGLARL